LVGVAGRLICRTACVGGVAPCTGEGEGAEEVWGDREHRAGGVAAVAEDAVGLETVALLRFRGWGMVS